MDARNFADVHDGSSSNILIMMNWDNFKRHHE